MSQLEGAPPDGRSALPPALAARARSWLLEGGGSIVSPRDAATVALLRDSEGGVEVYLLRRVAAMRFAAGMHVFPGGTVDERDRPVGDVATEVPWSGPPPASWAGRFATDDAGVRALACAAVRETYEESGVLLAGGAEVAGVVRDTTGEEWEADRLTLIARDLAFSDLLRRRGLVLRAELLGPWAHWITPEFEDRRYDTRFFVAGLPSGQRTRDVQGESDRVVWMRPGDAVEAFDAGRLAMLPPTYITLRELAGFGSVAEALAASPARAIRPLLPRPELVGEEVQLVVDADLP